MTKVGQKVQWRHRHRCGKFGHREVVWEGEVVKVYPKDHLLADRVRIQRNGKRWIVSKKHLVKD